MFNNIISSDPPKKFWEGKEKKCSFENITFFLFILVYVCIVVLGTVCK